MLVVVAVVVLVVLFVVLVEVVVVNTPKIQKVKGAMMRCNTRLGSISSGTSRISRRKNTVLGRSEITNKKNKQRTVDLL